MLVLDFLQKRGEYAPRVLQLVGTNEVVLLAREKIEEETLVGVGESQVL